MLLGTSAFLVRHNGELTELLLIYEALTRGPAGVASNVLDGGAAFTTVSTIGVGQQQQEQQQGS